MDGREKPDNVGDLLGNGVYGGPFPGDENHIAQQIMGTVQTCALEKKLSVLCMKGPRDYLCQQHVPILGMLQQRHRSGGVYQIQIPVVQTDIEICAFRDQLKELFHGLPFLTAAFQPFERRAYGHGYVLAGDGPHDVDDELTIAGILVWALDHRKIQLVCQPKGFGSSTAFN